MAGVQYGRVNISLFIGWLARLIPLKLALFSIYHPKILLAAATCETAG